jgi:hypothetical protein
MTNANILGRAAPAASAPKLAVSRVAFAFPAAQPGGGDQRRTQSRADDGGQRVQAADQQVPALDLRGPGCGVLILVPAGTARLNPCPRTTGREELTSEKPADWSFALCSGGYEHDPARMTITGRQPPTSGTWHGQR